MYNSSQLAMRDHLLIYVNGQRHVITGPQAFMPLSSYLRYELGLTGTKVVCAEGDCGSCSVLLGRIVNNRIEYQPVTSCIQFLFQLDCTHIVSIEGLTYDGKLNPVQEAMVACHGAQCGYCTPGFVVAMCAALEADREADAGELKTALVGNLCRCTGYEPILRAGMEVRRDELRRVDELYPPGPIVNDLAAHVAEPVLIRAGRNTFCKPVTVQQAVEFKAENPTCVAIAGGTDVGVQINKSIRDPDVVLSLSSLSELREMSEGDGMLSVGACVTLTELEHKTRTLCPELYRMLARHGSPLIRNAGTLAGNIANGSPIGDAMPALFVLNAEIELAGRGGTRRLNMNNFYTGYRRSVMTTDELITRVHIPLPKPGELFKLYKVSKRFDLDISTFTAAIWMRMNGDDVIDAIRIAYGGVAAVILRLPKTEQFLTGRTLTEETMSGAGEIARGEITPISDVRGSTDYRFQLAENILRRFLAEVRPSGGNQIDESGNGDGSREFSPSPSGVPM